MRESTSKHGSPNDVKPALKVDVTLFGPIIPAPTLLEV